MNEGHQPDWEQVELGMVVISGSGIQSCHIQLCNIHCDGVTEGWALRSINYQELKHVA